MGTFYGTAGSDNLIGTADSDYLAAYGGGFTQEIDILTGGLGADTFAIGDSSGMAYQGGVVPNHNLDYSYALITDFSWQEGDKIQAYGDAGLYKLEYGSWSGTAAQDTGVYYNNDLIAVMQDKSGPDVSIGLDFNFV